MGLNHPELTAILSMAFFILSGKTSCNFEVMEKGIRFFKNSLRKVEETDILVDEVIGVGQTAN